MGYATSMMKETGRAMRLDINHRRSKILTLSKGTSASALSRKYVRTYKNLSPSPLTGPSSLEMLKNPITLKILKDWSCLSCARPELSRASWVAVPHHKMGMPKQLAGFHIATQF